MDQNIKTFCAPIGCLFILLVSWLPVFWGVPAAKASESGDSLISASVASETSNASADRNQRLRLDTPSGFPVPRFVSLKSKQTNCRIGPSLQHPRKLSYARQGLPVKVIAETRDHWRKIEDVDGDRCWIHATLLSGRRTAIVTKENTALHARSSEDARVRARIAAGYVVDVEKCLDTMCLVKAGRLRGWIQSAGIWGYSGNKF